MDGIPSFNDAVNGSGNLSQDIANLAPLATTYHSGGVIPSVPVTYQAPRTQQGGALQQFGHWLGGVGTGIGHIVGGATTWLAKNTIQMAEAPFKFAYDFTKGAADTYSQAHQADQLAAQQAHLSSMWRAGQITTAEFQSGLKDVLNQSNDLSKQIQLNNQRLQNSKQEGINTAATILTLLTGPMAGAIKDTVGAGAAAKYLTSVNANAFLDTVESGLTKVAADPSLFAKLSPAAQKALQTSVAEVVGTGAKMTASQMARTAAVNLAFKYPIYYNYMSSTGGQLYNELQSKKYSAAIRTFAFNATLLLSGGPIGQAVKYGGTLVKGTAARTFERTSFIDALSKGIGPGGDNLNGDAAGLFKAVQALPASERADVVKQLSAVEATNLAAVGGDAEAAAMRVIKGMESYEGISMSQFSHEEALSNMVNFAKAQRIADEAGKAAGIGAVTVGRVDARDVNEISAGLSSIVGAGDRQAIHQAIDNYAAQNSTKAWANNENFMKQLHALGDKYAGDSAAFDNAMRNVKGAASFSLYRYKESIRGMTGFPEKVVKQLADMGYVPITPHNLEAPFTEGTGRLVSKFATGNDNYFLKAVQPLPILSTFGDALTKMGLSPNASTERVYQIFNDNLAKNLQESGVLPNIVGEDASNTADSMIKRLSEYAHNPTRGKIMSKVPITDLRMMTTADVQKALDVSVSEARAVQRAISQSFLQVPLAIRGFGDRLVDRSYQLAGPLQRRYLRVQGAARFSWNPFFQYLRVVPKTETLSEFEGGGFISSIFRGQLGQLRPIRNALRSGGFLEEGGFGNVISGEAADFTGVTTKNLTKKLLPAQENSIAGLIAAQAQKMGMDWRTYITENPQNVRDTIQMIAEYDKRSGLLNSPLMRTLNIAFFPMRFETKVAIIMTRSLAKTSLMTQVSVVNGLLRAHDWLNSAEGQSWYAKNASAIGFFEYITPVASLNQVFQSLLPGHDHSLGNFGELGGLPFGWIPQILDAEGLTSFNQPGVDAKTGQIIPRYIPASTRGQMAIAIQDFLSTLFSYPGATMGMPSKTSITRTAALGIVGGNKKTDLQPSTPSESQLSPQQRQYSQFIGSQNPTNPVPTPQPLSPSFAVPAQPTPLTTPKQKPASISSTKKKKSQFTPELLPGQTQLGQLP